MAEDQNKKNYPLPNRAHFQKKLKRDSIAILGVPIDNQDLEEVVQTLFLKLKEYQTDRTPRYISTVNTDFLVQAHNWFQSAPRHPELLRILRESTVATPDGMPIIWLSHLLGCPLKTRVSGVDLFMRLCEECALQQKTLFILGGGNETIKKAIEVLQDRYPEIKITGNSCSHITIDGNELANTPEQDRMLESCIEQASPDFLILCLGNPKQEIWFGRMQHCLKVPITIGLGGTLSFVAEKIPRAPLWMQKKGLEWVHRLFTEPKRLWKRYLIDLLKFSCMTLPLIGIHFWTSIVLFFQKQHQKHTVDLLNFRTSSSQIAILTLPTVLDQNQLIKINQTILEMDDFSEIIIDFQFVKSIDLKGMAFLIDSFLLLIEYHKKIHVIHLSSALRTLLRMHKVWDLVSPFHTPRSDDLFLLLTRDDPSPCLSIHLTDTFIVIYVFGILSDHMDYQREYTELEGLLKGRNCEVNLMYCTGIENAGFVFLAYLKKIQSEQQKSFKMIFLSPIIQDQLKIAHFTDK
jgi:N-acetylglucosaminyldiphosphoundecaprenol N-acetyl-beta-D-mannosaminyltransferase